MDWNAFLDALLSTQTPWLPDPMLMHWGRRLGWGLVLASLALWLGRRGPRRVQLGLAGLLGLWSLLPGPLSPAHWLGLAFQAPSLMTTVLCLLWGGAQLRAGGGALFDPARRRALWPLAAVGIVLGWLLLLDTFAVLPVALYAEGFSPAAVGAAALAACLPWVIFGSRHPARAVSLLLGAVVLLFVLLRLPSGNLWDALLDPLLWLVLQLTWLLRGLRWLKARRPVAAATRA